MCQRRQTSASESCVQLLARTPVHPAESINTALGRLSPTCRALWSTQWPTQKRLAALAGDEKAAKEVAARVASAWHTSL